MNIFVLAWDIECCGQSHCDQHVVKMILESAQIAYTAPQSARIEGSLPITHTQHPGVQ